MSVWKECEWGAVRQKKGRKTQLLFKTERGGGGQGKVFGAKKNGGITLGTPGVKWVFGRTRGIFNSILASQKDPPGDLQLVRPRAFDG